MTRTIRKVVLQVCAEDTDKAGQLCGEAAGELVIYQAEFHLSLREILSRVEGCVVPPEPRSAE